jgi:RNA polymerase sigma-70 factor, ECF subfamily
MSISLVLSGGYTARSVESRLTFENDEPSAPARGARSAPVDDDAALVRSIARGDAQALATVYDDYSRGVYSLALRLLGEGPAAEEVVQETFLKLWRQPEAFQPDRGRLLAWLLGVAHHRAVDVLRRRQMEQRHRVISPRSNGDALVDLVDNLGLASADGDPQSLADTVEQRTALGEALAALSTEQRLPLELAYYRGMTQAEVADVLHLPLGTVKTRMRLGLQQLRKAPGLWNLWSDR